MSKLTAGVTLLLCASAFACTGRRDLGPLLGRDRSVQLTVQNNRFEDAAIYALWQGGARRRVGTVTGKTSRTFRFERVSEAVRFEVDFVAAEDYVVEPVAVLDGDHLDLVIMDERR